ncbi:fibronectin type III domain-containing protein [Cohnella yongneupensis]|uniref:Fibronectin type III domain-containing protein n=1 Tax=Cohnella yongneupensis TaxID=425006 RepID=A0ABW0R0S4_9BACL
MRRKWMKFARTALALTVAWQAAAAWVGTDRAEAARTGQWTWESVGSGAVESSQALTFDLAVHDNEPYLFYSVGSGGGMGRVKAWNGSSWATIGGDFVSSDDIGSASIDIGQNGQIYVAYTNRNGYPYSAVVRKLDGESWAELGGGGSLSAPEGAGYTGVAAGPGGNPFMYYQEMLGSQQTFVRQFDGTAWTTAAAVSGINSNLPELTTNPSGQPAMIFADGSTGYYMAKAIIYDGSAWQTLGNDQFSGVSAQYATLRFASDGTAYAAFYTGNAPDNGVAYLYKLVAGTWQPLAQWDMHGLKKAALAIDPLTDAPFVAYVDRNGIAQVKQWNGAALADTAPLDGLVVNPDGLDMAFGDDGKAYLAFVDGLGQPNVVRYALETTPPALVSITPEAGATNASASAMLTATFNESIKKVPGHVIEICATASTDCQQVDAGSANVLTAGAIASIDMPVDLRGLTSYRAVAEAGAFADLNGNPAPEIEWTFTTAATVPDAPEVIDVIPDDGQAFVLFNAPDNGGSEILYYTVTAHPVSGGSDIVQDTTDMVYTMTGLTNGVSYTISVTAMNSIGRSATSEFRTVVPFTVPGAPTITRIESGITDTKVYFTPPASDGGRLITSYSVEALQEGVAKKSTSGSTSPIIVSGLVRGETYSFRVKALNVKGDSGWSAAVTGTQLTVPGAPTNVTAIGGNAQATVTFTPPVSDGGSPITGYRVDSIPYNPFEYPVSEIVGADKTSAVLTGLRPGAMYHFKVVTLNGIGESSEAQTTLWTTLAKEPAVPFNLVASAWNAKATVSFDEPDNGGNTITNYRVTAWIDDVEAGWAEGSSSPIEVTGLENGTTYTFTVEAYNENGWSAASSPSAAVTPSAVPGVPTNVTATAGDGTATVTFTAPANNGGSPITGYTVMASPGGAQLHLEADKREAQFTGLTNGTAYTFTVVATNLRGNSAASSPSAAVTPHGSTPPITSGSGSTELSFSYKVIVSAGDVSLGDLEVISVANTDGGYEEQLSLSAAFVQQAVDKLSKTGLSQLTLTIPGGNGHPPLTVSMPAEAAQALADAGVSLSIATTAAEVRVPADSLRSWGRELVLSIASVSDADQSSKLSEQASGESSVRDVAGNGKVTVIGAPVTIETNLRGEGRGITLLLPFDGAAPSEEQLRNIGVYIVHEDGTKELVKGRTASYGNPERPAYAFDVAKFSTFAIVNVEGWDTFAQRDSAKPYMSGFANNMFQPDKELTRAELATILSRLYANKLQATTQAAAPITFKDVPASHWAKNAIEAAAKLGLMKGMPDGSFQPDKPMTRAEMATIVASLLTASSGSANAAPSADIAGHWAEASILKAKAAGIMTGFKDGSFRPDKALSRAEAVTIINRLIGRKPSTASAPLYKDVSATYWAYGDIQAAAGAQ